MTDFTWTLRGWSFLIQQQGVVQRREGQKYLETCFRGLKNFYISFKGVEKFPYCLSKTFYIKCRGSIFFYFTREGGQKSFCSSERGVQNFCHSEFDHPPTAKL